MKKTNYKSNIMTYKTMNNINYSDLYFLIIELQRDIKHNYTLIKSLNTRISCLEQEIQCKNVVINKTNNIE